jgi:hypothetical protein
VSLYVGGLGGENSRLIVATTLICIRSSASGYETLGPQASVSAVDERGIEKGTVVWRSAGGQQERPAPRAEIARRPKKPPSRAGAPCLRVPT